MIGQKQLQSRIEKLIESGTFPRFSIFVGPRGSGKKTFVKEIVRFMYSYDLKEGADYSDITGIVPPDIKVDTIRRIIDESYKIVSPAMYCIFDADNMSNAAKNALLKVTEEPPNNAFFVMTLEDENNTLETIRSRGTVFHMDRYTPSEIAEYYGDNYFNEDDACWGSREAIIKELCETPGDVDILSKDVLLFYDYVQLVVDNIAEVSLANAFKIPSKVALKDTDDGYDLRLFWKAFMKVCMQGIFVKYEDKFKETDNSIKRIAAVNITSKYLQRLKVKGINRQMLMDNWVLEIRDLWM